MDDEIWRPGYDGPAPVSGDTSFDRAASSDGVGNAAAGRPWRLVVGVALAGATALAALVVVGPLPPGGRLDGSVDVFPPIDVIDDDRLQFVSTDGVDTPVAKPLQLLEEAGTPFVGADPRRLPEELVPLWMTELGQLVADGSASAVTWVEAVDRRYVVVGVGDTRALTGPAAVHVLDASMGRALWVAQFETRIDQIDFVAAFGDALVLTVGSEIVAYDLTTGSELWSGRLAKVDGALQQLRRLEGTDLLARSSPDPVDPIELIDPVTGSIVGEMTGRVLGTDRQGRWQVLRGAKILEYDLAPRANDEPISQIDVDMVGAVDSERSSDVAVIDGLLVTTLDEQLAIGPLEVDGERAADAGGLTPLTTDFGTPDGLVLVRGFVPLGGSGFAIVGGGTVSGAEVRDGTVRFAWQRRGTVTATYATERGVLLLVGTDGGSAQTLVDGASGEPIAALTMSPGLFGALEVVADGIVTRRTSEDGPRIAGLDLDGNELWALEGSTPASVGDGIVVRSTPQADGSFLVAAYGDLG